MCRGLAFFCAALGCWRVLALHLIHQMPLTSPGHTPGFPGMDWVWFRGPGASRPPVSFALPPSLSWCRTVVQPCSVGECDAGVFVATRWRELLILRACLVAFIPPCPVGTPANLWVPVVASPPVGLAWVPRGRTRNAPRGEVGVSVVSFATPSRWLTAGCFGAPTLVRSDGTI